MPTIAQLDGGQWVIARTADYPEIRFAPGTTSQQVELFEGWLSSGINTQYFARDALKEYARVQDSFAVQFTNAGLASSFAGAVAGYYDVSDNQANYKRANGIDGTITIDLARAGIRDGANNVILPELYLDLAHEFKHFRYGPHGTSYLETWSLSRAPTGSELGDLDDVYLTDAKDAWLSNYTFSYAGRSWSRADDQKSYEAAFLQREADTLAAQWGNVAHIVDHHADADLTEEQKTEGAEEFFAALVRHLPQLRALDKARKDPDSEVTTGSLRDLKGGDVALRGVGMAVFARAFLHCVEEGMDFDVMAAKLATIDWHVLAVERADIQPGPTFASDVMKNALPTWAHLLVIGESRYRVSSSSSDADAAWEKIKANIFGENRHAA